MPLRNILRLVVESFEKKQESKAWDMWLMKFQQMDKKNFKAFNEFYQSAKTIRISKQPTEEILKDVASIRQRARSKKG